MNRKLPKWMDFDIKNNAIVLSGIPQDIDKGKVII